MAVNACFSSVRFRGGRDRVRNGPWRGFLPRLQFFIYCFWCRQSDRLFQVAKKHNVSSYSKSFAGEKRGFSSLFLGLPKTVNQVQCAGTHPSPLRSERRTLAAPCTAGGVKANSYPEPGEPGKPGRTSPPALQCQVSGKEQQGAEETREVQRQRKRYIQATEEKPLCLFFLKNEKHSNKQDSYYRNLHPYTILLGFSPRAFRRSTALTTLRFSCQKREN